MSIPQPQFILIVNQADVEAITKILPGVVLAQVLGHDIGLDKLLLVATPKPVPVVPEVSVEEVPSEKSWE